MLFQFTRNSTGLRVAHFDGAIFLQYAHLAALRLEFFESPKRERQFVHGDETRLNYRLQQLTRGRM
jgi:hypothetical protein